MQYKTIICELLQQRPQMHEQLRKERMLLTMLEKYAKELRASHIGWQHLLSQLRRGCDPSQIASEALEIAIKELEGRLHSESPQNDSEGHFIDAAMLFLRYRTPHA